MNCILCGNKINTFGTGCENSDPNEFLDGAGFITFDFGYGSKFDCDQYVGQIHDKCFENILKNVNLIKSI